MKWDIHTNQGQATNPHSSCPPARLPRGLSHLQAPSTQYVDRMQSFLWMDATPYFPYGELIHSQPSTVQSLQPAASRLPTDNFLPLSCLSRGPSNLPPAWEMLSSHPRHENVVSSSRNIETGRLSTSRQLASSHAILPAANTTHLAYYPPPVYFACFKSWSLTGKQAAAARCTLALSVSS